MKIIPSQERGCGTKIKLGRNYRKSADRLAKKHGKNYGVYLCPYCKGYYVTTKLEIAAKYFDPLLYVTDFQFAKRQSLSEGCSHNEKSQQDRS